MITFTEKKIWSPAPNAIAAIENHTLMYELDRINSYELDKIGHIVK